MSLLIQKSQNLPIDNLTEMLKESTENGFRAIQRLVQEWVSGENRFERLGEALFLAQQDNQLVGICGLNIDPYSMTAATGRVRRLYVMRDYRRRGIGRALLRQLIAEACLSFDWLHLRTSDAVADHLYRSIGFTPHFDCEYFTHALELRFNR